MFLVPTKLYTFKFSLYEKTYSILVPIYIL